MKAAPPPTIERHWGMRQLGEQLGVHRVTVRRLVHEGHLQAVCVAGRVVIPESSVKRYLESNKLRTQPA